MNQQMLIYKDKAVLKTYVASNLAGLLKEPQDAIQVGSIGSW